MVAAVGDDDLIADRDELVGHDEHVGEHRPVLR
jgi:hypothetical protein